MDLLEFARGPALQFAALVLVAGTIWRIVGIVLLKKKPDLLGVSRTGRPRCRTQGDLHTCIHGSTFQESDAVSENHGIRHAYRIVCHDIPVHAAHRVF